MRDDFDEVVAGRFTLLDQVSVPDTWSKVRSRVLDERPVKFADLDGHDMTVADLETPCPTGKGGPRRGWILATAAVMVVVASRLCSSSAARASPPS